MVNLVFLLRLLHGSAIYDCLHRISVLTMPTQADWLHAECFNYGTKLSPQTIKQADQCVCYRLVESFLGGFC